MHITATKEQLLPALTRALAASGGGTLPVLEHLLLEPGDTLRITGSGLETEIIATAAVAAGGSAVALPGRKLFEIVRALPDMAEISIALTGDRCAIRSGRSRYILATLPAESFPEFDRQRNAATTTITFSAASLLAVLLRVRFASAKNDVRYYLNGVHITIERGTIRAVASDGHRVTLAEAEADVDATHKMILPNGGVDGMIRLLKSFNGDVEFSASTGCAQIVAGDCSFATKLVEGVYPDWRRVVPSEYAASCTVERLRLHDALRRLAVLASGDSICGVEVTTADGALILRTSNAQSEDAEEQVELSDFSGELTRLGYNARYLIDALSIAESDRVDLSIAASGGALICEPANERWQAFVMPMRI